MIRSSGKRHPECNCAIAPESTPDVAFQVRVINAKGSSWLKRVSRDRDFIRNAAAVLRPGNSAILAIIRDAQPALAVLSGYSPVVLHTAL
jgi:uncharacterized membrane protein